MGSVGAPNRVMASDDETTNEEHRARMKALREEQRAKVRSKQVDRGVVLVHTGDGKGKSTAAFGLALRALGNDMNVTIVQFIKGTWKTGEAEAFKRFERLEHIVSGEGFTWETQDRERDIAAARRGWEAAVERIERARQDPDSLHLLILDELNIALGYDYLPVEEVVEALVNKPEALSIAITGRNAKPEIIEVADTVSEMRMIKHAFEAGIRARRGIEF